MRAQITTRTAERLHRAAYDFEALTARFQSDGMDDYANDIAKVADTLRSLAKKLDRQLAGERDWP